MNNETIKTYQGGADCGQALVTLEGFIGDVDGKTIGTETTGGLFDDEGTVDASDAVIAINGLIWSLEKRDTEIDRLNAIFKRECDLTVDLRAECERLRKGYEDIKAAAVAGRVCDDVAWFDTITTLYDFCDLILNNGKLGDQQSGDQSK